MALGGASFRAFSDGELQDYLRGQQDRLGKQVAQEDENYILNVNETKYVDHLISKYSVDPLEVDFEGARIKKSRTELPAGRLQAAPQGSSASGTYEQSSVVYHLPFTGDRQLLCLETSAGPIRSVEVTVIDDCLCFEVLIRGEDSAGLEAEANGKIALLGKWLTHSRSEVEAHNRQLPEFARRTFSQRKNKILAENEMIAALELPLIERDDLPRTFAVSPLEDTHEIPIPKPAVTEQGYRTEPTLDAASHARVLEVVRDTLKVMEQHPSLCKGKDEEALRDLVLFQLTPRFKWSATAETFNRGGKTDILLRYENSNLFVAECKIWDGPSKYLAGIDQLLGYLTWRDSKAALIVFVRNKEITPVLEAVKDATPTHANWLGTADCPDEGVFHYRVYINGDRNREVKLAVFVCHIPPDA